MRSPMKSLGTSKVADLLQCSARTVGKLCDSGQLRSWHVPCSKHRRVHPQDLLQFMRANGYPKPLVAECELLVPTNPHDRQVNE
jgi:excisionase family DNA binding protein